MALTRPKYSQIYDTDWKQSVELATTADVGNLVLANVQPNSIDGVTVQTNYRILVKDQTSGAQNGIYLVRNAGTGSNGWWERSLDAAQSSFVTAGLTVSVVSGSANGGKEFRLTTPDPITLGVTPLTFINPFATASPAGANTQVQFNDAGITNATSGFTFNKYANILTINNGSIWMSGNGSTDGSITAQYQVTSTANINLLPSAGIIFSNPYNNAGDTAGMGGISISKLNTTNGDYSSYLSLHTRNNGSGTTERVRIGNTGNVTILGGNLNITGHILPTANVAYDLGTPTQRFRSAYFSGNTVYIGGESLSVAADGTWSFSSKGQSVRMGKDAALNPPSANIANITTTNISDQIYFNGATGYIGFNDTTPDFLYDFHAPASGGEILHVESGVGTQAWFGAQNYGGLRFAAGVDQDYVFSGSHDRPDHYILMTAGMVRANIHGHTGNVIFSNSISVNQEIKTTNFIANSFTTGSANITVRSDVTSLGHKVLGVSQLAIGTEDELAYGTDALYVTGSDSTFNSDVTITGNATLNNRLNTSTIADTGTGFVNVSISGNLITSFSDQRIQVGRSSYVQNQYVLWGITTNNVETEIFINGDGTSRIPVKSDTTMMFDVNLAARRTDANNVSASWHLKGCADNFQGNVQDVGDIYEIIVGTDNGNLVVDARADNTNDSLNLYVTGITGQTFRWVAVVKTIEVSQ